MSSTETAKQDVEHSKKAQNLVALFHCSFHPTKGNLVDWSAKASDNITLDGVEFCVLPSGLHLVEKDVIYFTHASHTGLALFRRRPTRLTGHRGFRLSAFGILLAGHEKRPRPWLHLPDLQELADKLYQSSDSRQDEGHDDGGGGDASGMMNVDWDIARIWFEERKITEKASDTDSMGAWTGWSDELDGPYASPYSPTHHLSHFLRLLGISSLTLYKHILARRRILILTLPPVEPACIFGWVAADMCRDYHGRAHNQNEDDPVRLLDEGPRVLGMITLSDMDRLEYESRRGTGWIACTTDAIFLDKPSNYDLLIDFTSSGSSSSSMATATPSTLDKKNSHTARNRPTLYLSKRVQQTDGDGTVHTFKKQKFKLDVVRFTWSDVRLWMELDRILRLDSSHNHPHSMVSTSSADTTKWSDPLRLYEDVCVLCATFWISSGLSIGSNSDTWKPSNFSADEDEWAASDEGVRVRNLGMGIEGIKVSDRKDRDRVSGSLRVRNLGMGIEGRPVKSRSASRGVVDVAPSPTQEPTTSNTKDTLVIPGGFTDDLSTIPSSRKYDDANEDDDKERLQKLHIRTTLALLQTFHAHTSFIVSQLREIVSQASGADPTASPGDLSRVSTAAGKAKANPSRSYVSVDDANTIIGDDRDADAIVLTPKDLLSLDLGILSDLDARFVEWLAVAEELSVPEDASAEQASINSHSKRRVVVKRNWKDVISVLLGLN